MTDNEWRTNMDEFWEHYNKANQLADEIINMDIEKTVPAATETANLHPVFENILQNYCTALGGK